MWHCSPIVLNAGKLQALPSKQPIDIALTVAMADLKARFIDPDKGIVRYADIRGSEEFDRYRETAAALQPFDLRSFRDRKEKLAFWINIYNTAVIHGVIELGIQKSVKEFPRFFDRVTYEVGGYRFSLNDMEHGILRGNRRHPYRLWKPFRRGDPRLEFIVQPFDPRVHFALVCGARSCPPIGFYEATEVDFQLQLAAQSFVNSSRVRIIKEEETVYVSQIFKWYRSDFGGRDRTVVETLLAYLDDGDGKTFLKDKRERVRIKYQAYDWNLNE